MYRNLKNAQGFAENQDTLRTLHLSRKIILALVALSIVSTVAALTALFTQNFPVTRVTSQITPHCGNTTGTTLTGSPSSVPAGFSTNILFNCSPNPAITVNAPVTATPSFTLPDEVSKLFAVPHSAGATSCDPTVAGAIMLQPSATAVNLPAGDFDYCAVTIIIPVGVTSITFPTGVTWSV